MLNVLSIIVWGKAARLESRRRASIEPVREVSYVFTLSYIVLGYMLQ